MRINEKKAPLVAEPSSQRLKLLELSGGACGNADGVAGGGSHGGACDGACGNVCVVLRLPRPLGSSLHPLSPKGRDSLASPVSKNTTTVASIGYQAYHSNE